MSVFSEAQQLAQRAALLGNVVNEFIVRPTGAPSTIGISGFIFDVIGDEELGFSSDITDHYVEENYAIEDHIALRPEMFTLRGYIGELNDIIPLPFGLPIGVPDVLPLLSEWLPEFSVQAAQVYGEVLGTVQASVSAVKQANSLYQLFTQKSTNATRQQGAFNYFYSMWKTRQLCTVETPYQIFDNMAIESVRAVQPGNTRIVSDFSVTFKHIRTIQTLVVPATKEAAGRAVGMLATTINKGKSVGTPANISVLEKFFS